MTLRRRALLAASASALLLALGAVSGADGASHAKRPPRIESGHYVEPAGRDVYLEVDVKKRGVAFHFTLYCVDPYASQNATSGPTPVKGELTGNRRGARVTAFGDYRRPLRIRHRNQLNTWTLKGKFTSPTDFKGRVEYEAGSFPPPPLTRPQCVDAARIHLTREP